MKILSHAKTLGIIQVDSSVWKKLTAEDMEEITTVCKSKLETYFSKLEARAKSEYPA